MSILLPVLKCSSHFILMWQVEWTTYLVGLPLHVTLGECSQEWEMLYCARPLLIVSFVISNRMRRLPISTLISVIQKPNACLRSVLAQLFSVHSSMPSFEAALKVGWHDETRARKWLHERGLLGGTIYTSV